MARGERVDSDWKDFEARLAASPLDGIGSFENGSTLVAQLGELQRSDVAQFCSAVDETPRTACVAALQHHSQTCVAIFQRLMSVEASIVAIMPVVDRSMALLGSKVPPSAHMPARHTLLMHMYIHIPTSHAHTHVRTYAYRHAYAHVYTHFYTHVYARVHPASAHQVCR